MRTGKLAAAKDGTGTETFLRDGLAPIRRDRTNYLNEPAVPGSGKPVIAGDQVLFTDLLGSTPGVKNGETFSAVNRTASGEVKSQSPVDPGILTLPESRRSTASDTHSSSATTVPTMANDSPPTRSSISTGGIIWRIAITACLRQLIQKYQKDGLEWISIGQSTGSSPQAWGKLSVLVESRMFYRTISTGEGKTSFLSVFVIVTAINAV